MSVRWSWFGTEIWKLTPCWCSKVFLSPHYDDSASSHFLSNGETLAMAPLIMELPVINAFPPLLPSSLCSCPCPCSSISIPSLFFHRRKMFLRFPEYRNSYPFLHTTPNASLSNATGRSNNERDIWDDHEFVEVIGIGSRKEAVLDFCLESALMTSSLRFW